ncbi:MAG: ATP-binding protein [Dehalococcoidia bacterium]|nr:ATP-binding protein [Dehalococcoidia bacterium]
MKREQLVLFDPRFLDSFAGARLLKDQKTALVELIANSWDAGATRVDVSWPGYGNSDGPFRIVDNGHGMTEQQFYRRWRTLAYNRSQEQGPFVEFPPGLDLPQRPAFGRNGVGRFAAFCFGHENRVRTWRDGIEVTFAVKRGESLPIEVTRVSESERGGTGTEIIVENPFPAKLTADHVRAEIGMRFLMDPHFEVYVAGERVSFEDIPVTNVDKIQVQLDGLGNVLISVIDTRKTDRTMKQHGIAWHVNGRLVGECSWKRSGQEAFLDGRRIPARRYTFIVSADCLANAVLPDWSWFNEDNELFGRVNSKVQHAIRDYLLEQSKEKRADNLNYIKQQHRDQIKQMSPLHAERWTNFVAQVQESCPSINDRDLLQLSGVLANLEVAESKYSLLHKLNELEPHQLDDLYTILDDWTVDMAKVVLDELQTRLVLIDDLRNKVSSKMTDEVHELQPLFHKGLWIFGPEFETIEFTSNEGMTTVIQRLFQSPQKGSRKRPDFVIIPDGTVGLYSYPKYDRSGGEIGIDRLVVVELKKPGIPISTDEKQQSWEYVKELYGKGLLQGHSLVTCFVVGSEVDPIEAEERSEKNDRVRIIPLDYNTVLERAKSRVLKLYDKVRTAPFLDQQAINDFLNPDQAISVGSQYEYDLEI